MTILNADSLQNLQAALEKTPYGIACDKEGKWYVQGKFMCFVRRVFPFINQCYVTRVHKLFQSWMDQLERTPRVEKELANRTCSVITSFNQAHHMSKTASKLSRFALAMDFRTGQKHISRPSKSTCVAVPSSLEEAAIKWKKKNPFYFREGDHELTSLEWEKLEEASEYRGFNDLLSKDPRMANDFFKWAFNSDGDVKSFILFPSVTDRIKQCYLATRIGRFAEQKLLRVEADEEKGSYDLTLLFNEKRVSVLDENIEVDLGLELKLPLKDIINIFAQKNVGMGNAELFGNGQGIINWNSCEMGYWDGKEYVRPNFSNEDWWKELPVFERMAKSALEARYDVKLEEGKWLFLSSATTQTLEPDIDKSHGYYVVAIPDGQGSYQILPFGKLPVRFPQSTIELLTFIGNTVPAKIYYPDENALMGHREQACYPVPLTPEQGKELMGIIAERIQADVFFQFAGQNCAHEPQMILERILKDDIPTLYRHPVADIHPTNWVMNRVFKCVRAHPKDKQPPIAAFFAKMFCLGRGMWIKNAEGKSEFVSLNQEPIMRDGSMEGPGMLNDRIRKGVLKNGVLWYGNLQLRERSQVLKVA